MITQFKIFEKNKQLPEIGDWVYFNPKYIPNNYQYLTHELAKLVTIKKVSKLRTKYKIKYDSNGWERTFTVYDGELRLTPDVFGKLHLLGKLNHFLIDWSKNKSDLDYCIESDKYNL